MSGYIPVGLNDTIYFYGFGFVEASPIVVLFIDANGQYLTSYRGDSLSLDENGVRSFKPSSFVSSNVSYFRFVFYANTADSGIVTVNQYPIQTVSTYSLRAQSVPYVNEPEVVTSYYADRMAEYYSMLGGVK
ncbi:MAG: hypothetical protein IKK14_05915 [Oscillospiraceae bacterium]|nr:hypothetical protein [Oscillospiraceae bacterium]